MCLHILKLNVEILSVVLRIDRQPFMLPISPLRFETRRLEDSTWSVFISWSDGETNRIDGFPNQLAAERWIEIDSAVWERAARLVRSTRRPT